MGGRTQRLELSALCSLQESGTAPLKFPGNLSSRCGIWAIKPAGLWAVACGCLGEPNSDAMKVSKKLHERQVSRSRLSNVVGSTPELAI